MNIRELCEKYNLSQSGLARRFGIPLRTVQNWCTGQRKAPDYVVRMIDELLRVDTRKARYEEAERQCIQSRGKAMRDFLEEQNRRDAERWKIIDQTSYRPDPDDQDEGYDYSQHLRPDERYQLTRNGPMMTEAELLERYMAEYRKREPNAPEFMFEIAAQAAVEQVKRNRACIRMRAEQIKDKEVDK